MSDILIIVEGEADVVFLMQYLSHLNLYESQSYKRGKPIALEGDNGTVSIIATDGKDCIKRQEVEIRKAIDNESKVIFIFDADDDVSLSRHNILKQWKGLVLSEKSAEPEIFLFPNDSDSGTLETLLIQCIHACNAPLLDYWQNLPGKQKDILSELNTRYKTCGDCTTRQTLHGPDDKMAIYSYAYQLTGNKAHETKRNYSDKKVWDLESKALEPLRDFLQKNI